MALLIDPFKIGAAAPPAVNYIGPVDTFDTSYDAAWTAVGGGCTVVSGRSRQEMVSNQEIATDFGYDLDEGETIVEVAPDTLANRESYLLFEKQTTAQLVYVLLVGNTLTFAVSGVGSASVTYDATDHRWWRIREATGDLNFDTSPNGATWTLRLTYPAHGQTLTPMKLKLGSSASSGGTGLYTYFDNLNSPPP